MERLFHINGMPREDFIPPVTVSLMHQDNPGYDAILEAGMKVLLGKMQH